MSNKATAIIIVSIICVAFITLLGIRFFSGEDDWICQNGQWIKHGNPSSSAPSTGCGETAKKEKKKEKNAETDTQETKAQTLDNIEGTNIVVDAPKANDLIGLPILIKGKARVFENTVNYRIKDSDESVLLENYATADSSDVGQFGPFSIAVNYPEPKGEKGTVEVFEYSAKDGSEINKVEIPVVFRKIESMNIKVFFGNRKENNDTENCNQIYEVERRIPKTQSVANQSLSELINGPTLKEGDDGFFSEINRNTKINKIAVEGGVAKVDFSKDLTEGISGSCEIETIKAQISSTLKQFPSVKDIKITVDGQSDILQ
jgi:hypothetical protein